MAYATLDERVLSGLITAADGHVFGIATGTTGGGPPIITNVVEVTPTSVVDLAVVAEGSTVIPIDGALLVTSSPVGGGWMRLPR